MPTYVPPVAAAPPATTDVEEGYKMAKLSGYMHFSNEHRADVTALVNAMEGLAVRDRQQRIMTELGKMWKALSEADKVSWKECAPIVKQKIKAKKKREVTGLREELASLKRENERLKKTPKLTISDAATGRAIKVPAVELYPIRSTVSFDEEVTWEIPVDKRAGYGGATHLIMEAGQSGIIRAFGVRGGVTLVTLRLPCGAVCEVESTALVASGDVAAKAKAAADRRFEQLRRREAEEEARRLAAIPEAAACGAAIREAYAREQAAALAAAPAAAIREAYAREQGAKKEAPAGERKLFGDATNTAPRGA